LEDRGVFEEKKNLHLGGRDYSRKPGVIPTGKKKKPLEGSERGDIGRSEQLPAQR